MSLSSACLNQHAKEDAIAKKWLLRGFLIAAGAHLGLIPLMAFAPPDVIAPPERIALVVTGPTDPLETPEKVTEEVPPEESVEALTEAIAQAELAAEAQVSGGPSLAPPTPIASFQPPTKPPSATKEPDPVAEEATETAAEPSPAQEAEDPEVADTSDSDERESDSAESNSAESDVKEPVETAANNTDSSGSPNLDALRERLSRARESRRNNENTDDTGETPAAATEIGADVARRGGPSEDSGNGSAAGDGSGSNRVSCRKCDRPAYPEEALDSGVEGSPSVSLEYDENGSVIGAVLEQSSGNAALDQAALEAARNYELDSGGRSGSVSIEIDFGIEGSERSRAAQRRGERESVSTPVPTQAPEQEVVREPVSEPESSTPEATTAPPPAENTPESRPEENISAPLLPNIEKPPAPEPERAPEPEVIAPPAPELAAPEPQAPVPDILPPPETAPLSEPITPPSPEPASIPDIGLPE